MIVSKISSKGQITIPKEIRQTMGVDYGDFVAYEIRKNVVSLKRIEPFDAAYHQALSDTLTEWSSPEDDEAFRDL